MRSRCFCVLLLALLVSPVRAADPTPLDPRGLPGPIVLAGEKPPSDARRAFFNLAGRKEAKIVVLADDTQKIADFAKPWEERKPASVTVLQTSDKKKANSADFVKPLTDATGVWITGNPKKLAAYRGTEVEKELKKLHARGGVVGGNAVSDFGFLPGFANGAATSQGIVGLRIPDGAGVVIRGRVARVIGDAPITIGIAKGAGKPAANEEYAAGSLLDLCQLHRAACNRCAKEPFPPAKPRTPVVPKGALVVVGGGGAGPNIWRKFI
jgi:hypothetical protein